LAINQAEDVGLPVQPGHEVANLKDELAAVVAKYFSAGMETLQYGEES
jgi:hypothetical protein